MESATVRCDGPGHLRALVCRLIADGKAFGVHGASGVVSMAVDPDDPLYLDERHAETADETVRFDFDDEAAKGSLAVRPGEYGPTLLVNGAEWGYVDMFHASPSWTEDPPAAPLPPQLLLSSPHNDAEVWAKVLVDPDNKMSVVLHREAVALPSHPRPIHSDGSDFVFSAPWEPAPVGDDPADPPGVDDAERRS